MWTVPTPQERQRILDKLCQGSRIDPAEARAALERVAAGLLVPDLLTIPFQANRWARPGERCTCGLPALVVYTGTRYGDLGFCGGDHG